MTKVVVFGGSGYAGSHIVEAAAVRGLEVVSVSRKESANQIAGAHYLVGSLLNAADRARAIGSADGADTADVIIVAVSARGDMQGQVRAGIASLATEAAAAGARLVVIGGAGSLRVSEGGPLVVDTPEFPEMIRAEAKEMSEVLGDLAEASEIAPSLDWLYISPAAGFGSFNAGEYRGEYRVGGSVGLVDDAGVSYISGADFGVAVVDELEDIEHQREQITFAY